MYKITEDDIDEFEELIEDDRLKLENSIQLFNDEWGIKIPSNSLVLIVGASGEGKTTLIREGIKGCILNCEKCLVFLNEETKTSYLRLIIDSLSKELGWSKRKTIKRVLKYCFIMDLEDTHHLEYWDKVPDIVISGIEEFEPEVVFFDQISYCRFNEKGDKKRPYEYLPEMMNEFKDYINCDDLKPPIVVVQEGNGEIGAVAGSSNKDATNTVNPSTHVFQVFRSGKLTYVEIQKFRNKPEGMKYKRYNKFEYDDELDALYFEGDSDELQDKYKPSNRNKRKTKWGKNRN